MPSESRRLHPFSVLVGIPIMQLVRLLIVPVVAGVASGRAPGTALLVVLFGAGLVVRILAWQRFRFSFDGRVLRVESGVLRRSRRSLDVSRIQQVELDRPLAQRLLGMATLRIETAASDTEPEIELRVLTLTEAQSLRTAIRSSVDAASGDAAPDATSDPVGPGTSPVVRVPLRHVALASVTGARLLVLPALLGAATQLLPDDLDEVIARVREWAGMVGRTDGTGTAITWTVVLLLGALLLLITTLIVGIVRDGAFRIDRAGSELVVRRGLLGTRDSTVPLRRVQVVRVLRNPVRRVLHMAAVRIQSAGGSGAGERRVIVPLVPESGVAPLLGRLLPGLGAVPPLRPHPPADCRRVWLRRTRAALGVLALVALALRIGPAVPADPGLVLAALTVALLLLTWLLSELEYRALGHGSDRQVLVAQQGALTVVTSVVPLGRVQAVTMRTSWFQARRGLSDVVAHVAGPGGDVLVRDMAHADAAALQQLLASAAAGR
jgi:putative membrane protein